MSELFSVSYVFLWILVVLLAILVILIYRHFGLQMMSGTERRSLGGLDIGSRAPALASGGTDEHGEPAIRWTSRNSEDGEHKYSLMVLTSLTCTLCKTLRQNPRLAALTEEWPSIQFVWVDEKQDLLNPPLKGWTVAVDPDRAALTAFAVPATPFAYVIDTTGRVAGKSLVNTPSDMAALLGRLFPDSALEGRASQAQSA